MMERRDGEPAPLRALAGHAVGSGSQHWKWICVSLLAKPAWPRAPQPSLRRSPALSKCL